MEVDQDRPGAPFLTAPLRSLATAPWPTAPWPTAPADNAPVERDVEASIQQEVISILLDNSEPAPPPKAWSFIEPTDEIRQLTLGPYASGPHALGAELKRRFTEQQIVAAGKVTREPLLNRLMRLFGGADHKFTVIRGEARPDQAICTEIGHLWPQEPPALTPALRRVDATSNTGTVPLLLAETVDDVQVLRGLGFDAELSFGLQGLTAAAIEQLFAQDSTDECWLHDLMIADWNVSSVDCSNRPRAPAIMKRLSLMQETYGRDPGRRFSRWSPDKKTRSAIRNARDFQDAQRARDLIQSSFPKQQLGKTWSYHIRPAPPTYLGARTTLHNLLTQSFEIPRVAGVKKALEDFRTIFQSQVTAQLYAQAESAGSPVARVMIHQATELQERWFESQAIVEAAKRVIAGKHPGADWQLNADDFTDRVVLNGKLFAMFNKLQSMNGCSTIGSMQRSAAAKM